MTKFIAKFLAQQAAFLIAIGSVNFPGQSQISFGGVNALSKLSKLSKIQKRSAPAASKISSQSRQRHGGHLVLRAPTPNTNPRACFLRSVCTSLSRAKNFSLDCAWNGVAGACSLAGWAVFVPVLASFGLLSQIMPPASEGMIAGVGSGLKSMMLTSAASFSIEAAKVSAIGFIAAGYAFLVHYGVTMAGVSMTVLIPMVSWEFYNDYFKGVMSGGGDDSGSAGGTGNGGADLAGSHGMLSLMGESDSESMPKRLIQILLPGSQEELKLQDPGQFHFNVLEAANSELQQLAESVPLHEQLQKIAAEQQMLVEEQQKQLVSGTPQTLRQRGGALQSQQPQSSAPEVTSNSVIQMCTDSASPDSAQQQDADMKDSADNLDGVSPESNSEICPDPKDSEEASLSVLVSASIIHAIHKAALMACKGKDNASYIVQFNEILKTMDMKLYEAPTQSSGTASSGSSASQRAGVGAKQQGSETIFQAQIQAQQQTALQQKLQQQRKEYGGPFFAIKNEKTGCVSGEHCIGAKIQNKLEFVLIGAFHIAAMGGHLSPMIVSNLMNSEDGISKIMMLRNLPVNVMQLIELAKKVLGEEIAAKDSAAKDFAAKEVASSSAAFSSSAKKTQKEQSHKLGGSDPAGQDVDMADSNTPMSG